MNTQPKHDLETGDLRGSAEIVVTPNGINVGDLPNTDTTTDDLRGHESSSVTDAETDNARMFVGAAAVAALIGALGVASYATGMWNAPRPAFAHRVAVADIAVPVVASPHAVVPPAVPVAPPLAIVPPAASVQVAPPNEIIRAPVSPHVAKRVAAPVLRAQPALTPPETTSPEPPMNTTLTPAPVEPVPTSPAPTDPALPALSLPDLPSAASPPVKPTEPPQ